MAPLSVVQDQFGGGIFRGRRAPADSVYDAVNALLNDERELYRRGGSVYKSGSNADGTLLGLFDGVTVAGQRTFFWSATSPYVLDSNDSSILDLGSSVPSPLVRGWELGGLVFFRAPQSGGYEREVMYAGSRKTADYGPSLTLTGNVGEVTVTGTGTTFLANVDPGMLIVNNLAAGVDSVYAIVKSVESNTSLTVTKPLTIAVGGASMRFTPVVKYGVTTGDPFELLPQNTTAALAVAGQRLLRARDNRVYFSRRVTDSLWLKQSGIAHPATFANVSVVGSTRVATDYYEMPRAGYVIGMDAIQDTAIVFATNGVWAIANLALDPFDGVGNIQHSVAQVSQDVILWDDPGIAAYSGSLIVPAIDDVYAFSLGAPPVPVSQGVRPLYREYVEAGYKPGTATVYRGHYWLPILDGSNNVVDVLVCRLDLADFNGARRPGWARQANGAAGRAYATRIGATARTPKLLGLDGLRVSDLTGCFDPDATRKADADGTNHAETIIGNDVPTPGGRANTVLSALVTCELVDAASDNPTYSFSTAVGAEGASFTAATAMDTGASSAPETDGTAPTQFSILRKADRIRWKWVTAGAAASAILRRVELKIRPSGRQ